MMTNCFSNLANDNRLKEMREREIWGQGLSGHRVPCLKAGWAASWQTGRQACCSVHSNPDYPARGLAWGRTGEPSP